MTDTPAWGPGADGQPGRPANGGDAGPHQVRPWFPPSGTGPDQPPPGPGYGQPGGYPPPPPGPGYGQPGGYPPPPGSWQWAQPAPKPGVIPLRPLAVGEILDGAFTSTRRNPKATLGLAAVVLAISAIISTAATLPFRDSLATLTSLGANPTQAQVSAWFSRLLSAAIPAAAVSVLLAFVVDIVLTGLLTVVIGRSVLGDRVSAGQAWRLARSRLPALLRAVLLVLAILAGVWVMLVVLIAVLLLVGAPGALVALLGLAGGIAALCVTVWFSVMFQLTAPVVVLEQQPAARALARSWRLVRGSFWRVFGILLLAELIVVVAGAVLQIPFSVLAAVTAGGGGTTFPGFGSLAATSLLATVIGAVGAVVAGAVTRPIAAGVTVLLYVDLRMRREGLDLVLRSAAGATRSGDEFASLWRPGAATSAATGPMGASPPAPGAPPAW